MVSNNSSEDRADVTYTRCFSMSISMLSIPPGEKNRRLQVTMIEVLQRISRKINMFSLR